MHHYRGKVAPYCDRDSLTSAFATAMLQSVLVGLTVGLTLKVIFNA